MKIKPVKHYKKPEYPNRLELFSNPSLLQENIPTRWKNNRIIAAALAVFFFGSGDTAERTEDRPTEMQAMPGCDNKNDSSIDKFSTLMDIPSIAPIFIHGDGTGAIGCVVINPPAFLSEEEARQIIETEFKKENIIFDKKNFRIDDAVFIHENRYGFGKTDKDTVIIDAYSSEYNLGYEVITIDDYVKFGGERSHSTVQSYDLISAADNLRTKMKEHGKINTAIFYDPIVRTNYDEKHKNTTYEYMQRNEIEDYENDGYKVDKSESIALLKLQIYDFIEWMKKENLLKSK